MHFDGEITGAICRICGKFCKCGAKFCDDSAAASREFAAKLAMGLPLP